MSKTWFITGTSSGFGRVMTETLLARGDRVAATLRKPAALDELKAAYGERLWVATLELADGAAIRDTVDRAFAELGRIDVVVNNAGYAVFGAAEEASDAQVLRQLDTNLTASIRVIRAALPHLRAQGGGRIVQVSSEGGQIAYPNFSLYHASKWGIEGFVEAVAQEVATFGIRCSIFEPGAARTSFGQGLDAPPPIEAYEDSPAGAVRRAIADGSFGVKGDPSKMVDAMIASVDEDRSTDPSPTRLALGRASYTNIRAALVKRLAALDAAKDVTTSVDVDD